MKQNHDMELGDGFQLDDGMELDINLAILRIESAEKYHAKAKHNLSSHQLLDFMKCPLLHRKKTIGLIGDSDSVSDLIGRAAHVRILEGREVYEATFALGGPVNPKTEKPYGVNTQAFREWAEEQGKLVLSHEQVELIEQMAAGVSMNSEALDLLLYGRSEGVVRVEYCGIPCQIRIDWLHPHRGIVDFKTCDDITWFEADAKRHGYHKQMAFYQSVLAQAHDGLMVPVHLIVIEKKEPFRCGVWRVTDDTLAIARQENEAAIHRLLNCRRQDQWPTGYEDIRFLNVA
ncbi:MAG: PD-(D/E)XK nuclease-like domain-containing protein [Phycisphaerales bacterium]|nr:PD-(D/E)XK nuclease-like domain-containing protein [Phycisphaerales bacterium]